MIVVTASCWILSVHREIQTAVGEADGMSAVEENVKEALPPLGKKPYTNDFWLAYLFGKTKAKGYRAERFRPTPTPTLQRSSTGSWDSSLALGYSSAPESGSEPTKFERHHSRSGRSVKGTVKPGADGHQRRVPAETPSDGFSPGVCQVRLKDGGGHGKLKRANVATQAQVYKQIESWSEAAVEKYLASENTEQLKPSEQKAPRTQIGSSAGAKTPLQEVSTATNRQQEQKVTGEEGELVTPKHLVPTGRVPDLNKRSILLKEHHLKGIMAVIPKRMRQANWQLLYSTARHGYSLQSLYRRAAGFAPTILVIKDPEEHIFGSYCSEPWKVAPRFYGTGESFVFQLEPQMVYYPWKRGHKIRNDYFMFGSPDSIGIGGSGHFALWLDGDLLYGHSGVCDTFGSPSLASKEEFKILVLELWMLL